MLASLDVHTDRTIGWGKTALNRFAKFAQVGKMSHFFTCVNIANTPKLGIRPRGMEFP